MKHILLNPHNGAPVEHDGVKLLPGEALHVLQHLGEALVERFSFLLLQVVPGDDKGVAKAKPGKITGRLEWQPENVGTDELPKPDSVNHVVTKSAKAPAAAKKTATAPAKKGAAAK